MDVCKNVFRNCHGKKQFMACFVCARNTVKYSGAFYILVCIHVSYNSCIRSPRVIE